MSRAKIEELQVRAKRVLVVMMHAHVTVEQVIKQVSHAHFRSLTQLLCMAAAAMRVGRAGDGSVL